jgi:iron complex transport system ATP-binding protein
VHPLTDSNSNISFSDLSIGYEGSGQNGKFPMMTATVSSRNLIVLVGRNGVGKSTLLRTLAGLQPPVSGKLTLMGKDISQYSQKERAAIVSFVSTEKPDIADMTVFDLVSLGRYLYTNWLGTMDESDRAAVTKAMTMTGISHLADDSISKISDGELQRAMIARTLAQNTPVIILDEPVAFLDLPNKFEILLLLRSLAWNEKKTVILSAHDLDIAMRLADMLWIMTPKSLEQGAPEDIAISRGLEAIFRNSKILFDYNTGTVDTGIRPTGKISLACEDPAAGFWLNRAFNRLGFEVSDSAEISVEVKNGKYVCIKDSVEKECFSVYELCNEIRNTCLMQTEKVSPYPIPQAD